MSAIRIQLEYKCYPVWLYDDDGIIEDTALPPELSGDRELDVRFRSIQERFDATYADTPTDFYNKGLATPEEEAAFRSDRPRPLRCSPRSAPRGIRWSCPQSLASESGLLSS